MSHVHNRLCVGRPKEEGAQKGDGGGVEQQTCLQGSNGGPRAIAGTVLYYALVAILILMRCFI